MKRITIFSLLAIGLFTFSETNIENFDIFSKAVGNASISFSTSLNSFNFNPANVTNFESGTFTLFIPSLGFNKESHDLYKFYMDNKDRFESDDFEPLDDLDWDEIDDILSKDPFLALQLPINFYILTKPDKWGIQTLFGLNAYTRIKTNIDKGVIPPVSSYISAEAIGDIYVPFSISKQFKIKSYRLNVGTTLKYIHREKVFIDKSLTPALVNYVPVRYSGDGFGIDLGAVFDYNDQMNFGASLLNVGGTRFCWTAEKFDEDDTRPVTIDTNPTYIDPILNLGFTYFPKIKGLPKFIKNNFISVSLNDILKPQDYLLNHLKIGLGTNIYKAFNIYMGLNGGYPTIGTDIDIWVFHLSYAYYTIELGKYPGQIADSRHLFSMSFSGMKRITPRESRWRKIKDVKEKPAEHSSGVSKEPTQAQIDKSVKKAQSEADKKRQEELRKEAEIKKMQKQAEEELQKESTAGHSSGVSQEEIAHEEKKVAEEILEEVKIEKKEEVLEEIKILPRKKTEKEVKIVLNIKFPPGKTFILESQKSDLYTALEGVKKSKGHIMINSYTDSSGSAAINLKLSKLRAAEVKKFFIENGIDPSRLIVKGWGATNPIADNSTREGRTKNRRIEIVIKVEE